MRQLMICLLVIYMASVSSVCFAATNLHKENKGADWGGADYMPEEKQFRMVDIISKKRDGASLSKYNTHISNKGIRSFS